MAKTILIVDDTKSILAVMKTVLKVAGYNILTAGDGVEDLGCHLYLKFLLFQYHLFFN